MAKKLTEQQRLFVTDYLDGLTVSEAMLQSELEFQQIPECGWYVYLLIDPRNDRIFYVGKGKGNRMHVHSARAYEDNSNITKSFKIREILSSGHEVKAVVFESFRRENDAFSVEEQLITALRDGLTNKAKGVANPRTDAQAMLDNLKPLDVWLRDVEALDPETKALNERVFGDPRKFYEKFKESLQDLVERTQARVIHCGKANKIQLEGRA